MKIIDITKISNNVLDYIKTKPNILVYRQVNKLEKRKTMGQKKIPWYSHPMGIEITFQFCTKNSITLEIMKIAYLLAKMLKANIKWPNDVVVNGKKIAGVMAINLNDNYYSIGIGVNLNNKTFINQVVNKATSYFLTYKKTWKAQDFVQTFANKLKTLKQITVKDLEAKQVFKNQKLLINGSNYQFIGLNNDGSARWKFDGQVKTFYHLNLSFSDHYHLLNQNEV